MPTRKIFSRSILLAIPLAIVACVTGCAHAEGNEDNISEQETFFEKEIRPLLARRCYECHGRLEKVKGSLSLVSREAILRGGESGPAATPGNAAASLLMQAVRHDGLEMPPDRQLPNEEIAKLEAWIAAGMHWPAVSSTGNANRGDSSFVLTDEDRRFWSFQPIQDYVPPAVTDTSWPLNDVDRFVLAALESRNIRPNPPADKRKLIRRATYDLTGLPPTLEEIHDFLNDESPAAFAKVVDRLLASRHYGERWGRYWLDVVRYADTAGDGADYPIREAYKYRNYVVDAFNSDKPYDQFLREQIAGDILARQRPDASFAELTIATGYIAVTKRFGYNINKEFHHLDIADTLETLGRSVLGLSIGCARCHDHKYDPVSTADYYALYGIFNSSKYSFPGGEEHKRPHELVPLVPPAEVARLEADRQLQLATLDERLRAIDGERMKMAGQLNPYGFLDADFELQKAGEAPSKPWFTAGPNKISAEAQSPFTKVYAAGKQGLRLSNGGKTDGLRQEFAVPYQRDKDKLLHFNVDFRNIEGIEGGGGSYRFYLGQGAIGSMAIEFCANGDALVIRNGDQFEEIGKLKNNEWYNVQLKLDLTEKVWSGTIGGGEKAIEFANKRFHPAWNGVIDTFFIDGWGSVEGTKPMHDIDNLALSSTEFKPVHEQADALAAAAHDIDLRDSELAKAQEKLAELEKQAAELQQERHAIAAATLYEVAYGVSEGEPANARVQKRGEPTNLGNEIPRRFLEILGGDLVTAAAAGSGRLQLADWLTRTENPLTARVMVNRIWQYHFGSGIVDTPSDFGLRGQPPTHPELLDYLASRFIEDGWSIKNMHRRLMLSRVYQLSSENRPELMPVDPRNKWLWKYQRRRLDAEAMRDSMLALSGNLDDSVGQAHPFPPVEQWGFTIHYPFHAVYETNRRSVYLMTQRSRKHPYLSLFDAADNNISTAVRMTTTTPTQALYLMNDPFVHEQASGLAAHWLSSRANDEARMNLAYESVLGRWPDNEERLWATEFLNRYQQQVAALGQSPDQQPAAAWSGFARVLLTSNGFLFVD